MDAVMKFDHVRNNKTGNLYIVLGFVTDSETLEEKVRYMDSLGKEWVRPVELFKQKFMLVARYR